MSSVQVQSEGENLPKVPEGAEDAVGSGEAAEGEEKANGSEGRHTPR